MITNERQYRIAKSRVRDIDAAVEQVRQRHADKPASVREAYIQALRSNVTSMQGEIEEYERLRDGMADLHATGLAELPALLIRARIARRWTQKDLAERLGVSPQQVQRWETNEYHGVSIERLTQIAALLGVTVEERVESGAEMLTKTEVQLLRLLTEGRSAQEVAVELQIGRRNVEAHLRHLRRRLREASEVYLTVPTRPRG